MTICDYADCEHEGFYNAVPDDIDPGEVFTADVARWRCMRHMDGLQPVVRLDSDSAGADSDVRLMRTQTDRLASAADVRLPKTLSRLIRLAIADGRRIDRTAYLADASRYHEPEKDGCAVCFAGVVIAGTKQTSPDVEALPAEFDEYTANRLIALDEVRRGNISNALEMLEADHSAAYADCVEAGIWTAEQGRAIAELEMSVGVSEHNNFDGWEDFDNFCDWALDAAQRLENIGF